MHFQKCGFLMLLLVMGAANLRAQWVPVSAKMKQTVETMENGKVVKVEHKEGNFYRTSDGSTLRYWTQIDGDEKLGGSGELSDNKNLFHYSINFKTKQAFQVGPRDQMPVTPDSELTSRSRLGDDFVEGIRCRRCAVFIGWPDGRREPSGEICESIEYVLTLREDRHATQNGVTRHSVMEMYDIKLGVEPDRKLFDIEKNYTVFRPDKP